MRRRLIVAILAIGLSACNRRPPAPTQITDVVVPTVPAGQVGLFVFRDRVIVVNKAPTSVQACVIVLDEAFRGELGALNAGETRTLMQTRFSPYSNPDEFYARGSKRSRMDCQGPTGLLSVTFGGQYEKTVTIAPRRRGEK